MKVNFTGCTLCDSTWGDYYETIEGTKLFFCCDVCASLFRQIINILKEKLSLSTIDEFHITGTSRKRTFQLFTEGNKFTGDITFANGKILVVNIE